MGGGVDGWWLTPTTYIQLAGAGSIFNFMIERTFENNFISFLASYPPKLSRAVSKQLHIFRIWRKSTRSTFSFKETWKDRGGLLISSKQMEEQVSSGQ